LGRALFFNSKNKLGRQVVAIFEFLGKSPGKLRLKLECMSGMDNAGDDSPASPSVS
jgi:hypothetical protein